MFKVKSGKIANLVCLENNENSNTRIIAILFLIRHSGRCNVTAVFINIYEDILKLVNKIKQH